MQAPRNTCCHDQEDALTLTYPLQMKRRGVETKLIIGGVTLGRPDEEMIRLVAKARQWYEGLKTGSHNSIGEISGSKNMDRADVSRTLALAFLAPSIITDIIEGRHPVDLGAESLRRKASSLPMDWSEQRSFLGFHSET